MINVKVKQTSTHMSLHISGHANMGEYGEDIVCSAVSCLCFSIANQLLLLDADLDISVLDNDFKFNEINLNHDNKLLLDTLQNGLFNIMEEYPQAIKIMEVEAC